MQRISTTMGIDDQIYANRNNIIINTMYPLIPGQTKRECESDILLETPKDPTLPLNYKQSFLCLIVSGFTVWNFSFTRK